MVTPFHEGTIVRSRSYNASISDLCAKGPLVVLAPHPDDEALGCGGAIAAASKEGKEIFIICITDGSKSHTHSATWPKERLIAQRRQEFLQSCALLSGGKAKSFMLSYKDQESPATEQEILKAAQEIIKLVGTPIKTLWASWIHDPHIDHAHTAKIAYKLKALFPAIALYFYPVWGRFIEHPLEENTKVLSFDSAPYQKIKEQAIMSHLSQMTKLIEDDPYGFVMEKQTREHFLKAPEYFLKIA